MSKKLYQVTINIISTPQKTVLFKTSPQKGHEPEELVYLPCLRRVAKFMEFNPDCPQSRQNQKGTDVFDHHFTL